MPPEHQTTTANSASPRGRRRRGWWHIAAAGTWAARRRRRNTCRFRRPPGRVPRRRRLPPRSLCRLQFTRRLASLPNPHRTHNHSITPRQTLPARLPLPQHIDQRVRPLLSRQYLQHLHRLRRRFVPLRKHRLDLTLNRKTRDHARRTRRDDPRPKTSKRRLIRFRTILARTHLLATLLPITPLASRLPDPNDPYQQQHRPRTRHDHHRGRIHKPQPTRILWRHHSSRATLGARLSSAAPNTITAAATAADRSGTTSPARQPAPQASSSPSPASKPASLSATLRSLPSAPIHPFRTAPPADC